MMENLKKTLPSGAMLEISMASFSEAENLLKVVSRELETINIKLGSEGLTLKEIFSGGGKNIGEEALNTLKNIIVRVISSENINSALTPCIMRGTYNGTKINGETFDQPETWGDYLIIRKEVLMYILSPFVKNLSSLLPEGTQKNINTLNQKSS